MILWRLLNWLRRRNVAYRLSEWWIRRRSRAGDYRKQLERFDKAEMLRTNRIARQ